LLSHFGCELVATDSDKIYEHHFGFKVSTDKGTTVITRIAPDSPASKAGLGKDEEIIAVNEIKVDNNLNELMNQYSGRITLTVFTVMKKQRNITLQSSDEKYFQVYELVQKENATTSEQKFFSEWMKSSVRQHSTSLN
jgi:predicted metalloprotease with PDZ domain